MATLHYKDYRIELEAFPIPGGWSARGQLWNFETGTARVEPFTLPPRLPFPSPEAAQTYATMVAYRLVEQRRPPQSVAPPRPQAERLPDEQRERAAAYAPAYAESKG
jgi:hypothetical protein